MWGKWGKQHCRTNQNYRTTTKSRSKLRYVLFSAPAKANKILSLYRKKGTGKILYPCTPPISFYNSSLDSKSNQASAKDILRHRVCLVPLELGGPWTASVVPGHHVHLIQHRVCLVPLELGGLAHSLYHADSICASCAI